MTDPLKVLREYHSNRKEIIERGNEIVFGDLKWPKETATNYPSSRKSTLEKEYYTLECLLYFLKNTKVNHPEYCKQAAEANILAVYRPDRKKLLAYLNSETEIINTVNIKKPTKVKHSQENDTSSAAKKPRTKKSHVHKRNKSKSSLSA